MHHLVMCRGLHMEMKCAMNTGKKKEMISQYHARRGTMDKIVSLSQKTGLLIQTFSHTTASAPSVLALRNYRHKPYVVVRLCFCDRLENSESHMSSTLTLKYGNPVQLHLPLVGKVLAQQGEEDLFTKCTRDIKLRKKLEHGQQAKDLGGGESNPGHQSS